MSSPVDVIILGAGPASLATAITLLGAGRSVVIKARAQKERCFIGESLAPAAKILMRRLGVWETFVTDDHLPCYANRSIWGSDEPRHFDFIGHPRGHGYHIDRRLFEQRLMERAALLGARFAPISAPLEVHKVETCWQLRSAGRTESTSFIVDATGRACWFARRQGVARLDKDRQIALVVFIGNHVQPVDDFSTLVEATAHGWWYSAPLPCHRLVTAFFTDIDLHTPRELASKKGWRNLLFRAPATRTRVEQRGNSLCGRPAFVAAGSGRLARFSGDGWLAVGDAAMAFDPLSAHGLTVALKSGCDAADAICAHQAGTPQAIEDYCSQLEEAFAAYASIRAHLYRSESRFVSQTYWRRRQS